MVDFKDHLRRQIKFLENSCKIYDEGGVDEAIRIAVALRVLFHDSRSSTSLLKHLGANSISVISTVAPYVEGPVAPNLYLVKLLADLILTDSNQKAKFRCHCVPRLDTALRKDQISLEAWWQQEKVIKHKDPPTALTRRDLVLAAANRDGGAHVDSQLDPVYDYVRLGSGLELTIVLKPLPGLPPSMQAPFENIHFASLRQIAFEVLNSPAIRSLT